MLQAAGGARKEGRESGRVIIFRYPSGKTAGHKGKTAGPKGKTAGPKGKTEGSRKGSAVLGKKTGWNRLMQ